MFGKNKVSQEEIEKLKNTVELDEAFFEDIGGKKEMFDATVSEMTDSYRQVEVGVNQVHDNIRTASELASGNVEIESEIGHRINDYRETLAEWDARQRTVIQEFHRIQDRVMELVDENKHFTSPSKFISEFPTNVKSGNDATRVSLDQMAEYGKQMGVLALNAAIEAGRLGDAGKQFVAAAEDIRTYAANYDRVIEDARKQLAESDDRIQELEEQVHRLISLLKDNNVSTARLMKSCKDTADHADELVGSFSSERLGEIYNQVTALRNADEEIVKSEERNRMQMEDLSEELGTQQKNQKELLQMVDPLFRHVIERKE